MKKLLIEIGGKPFYYILKTYYSIVVIAIIIMFLSSCGIVKYDANGSLIKGNGSTHCGTFR